MVSLTLVDPGENRMPAKIPIVKVDKNEKSVEVYFVEHKENTVDANKKTESKKTEQVMFAVNQQLRTDWFKKEAFYLYIFTQRKDEDVFLQVCEIENNKVKSNQAKREFRQILQENDLAYYNRIISLQSDFFDRLSVTSFSVSASRTDHLLYSNPDSKIIVDFLMSAGHIKGSNHEDVESGLAVGIRSLENVIKFGLMGDQKMWILRKQEEVVQQSLFMTVSDDVETLNEPSKYKQINPVFRNPMVIVPIEGMDDDDSLEMQYCLVFRDRSISVADLKYCHENRLITIVSDCERDHIASGFVTGEWPDVQIHYIE